MKNILIATTKAPTADTYKLFCETITDIALVHHGVIIGNIEVTEGPNCCNIAMEAEGEEAQIQNCASSLTIALFPARWTYTTDKPRNGYFLTSQADKQATL